MCGGGVSPLMPNSTNCRTRCGQSPTRRATFDHMWMQHSPPNLSFPGSPTQKAKAFTHAWLTPRGSKSSHPPKPTSSVRKVTPQEENKCHQPHALSSHWTRAQASHEAEAPHLHVSFPGRAAWQDAMKGLCSPLAFFRK